MAAHPHLPGLSSLVFPYSWNGNCSKLERPRLRVDVLKLIKGIADVLSYLHSMCPPVIHGDIKAANVMLSNDFSPLLTDFGLAEFTSMTPSNNNEDSELPGSMRWMALELFHGEEHQKTIMSDVWAFGMFVLEVSSQKMPFCELKNDQKVILALLMHNLPAFPVPTAVHELTISCWNMTPTEWPSASNLVTRLSIW
ncbi:hypothetical protein M0805_003566 [Coniferiporia weirii]|nr:hypothetical protein M0805_003566 [Coniferiporia weirii]